MRRGTDSWSGSGTVVGEVKFGKTSSDNEACSFKLCIDKKNKSRVVVRVNAYAGNAKVAKKRGLKRGDYCVVSGELMNRRGANEELTEVRCEEIVIMSDDENGGLL